MPCLLIPKQKQWCVEVREYWSEYVNTVVNVFTWKVMSGGR